MAFSMLIATCGGVGVDGLAWVVDALVPLDSCMGWMGADIPRRGGGEWGLAFLRGNGSIALETCDVSQTEVDAGGGMVGVGMAVGSVGNW